MRFKKSIIITLFLLCILMISAVSASENITYKTNSLEEKTILDSEKSSDTDSKININDIDINKITVLQANALHYILHITVQELLMI